MKKIFDAIMAIFINGIEFLTGFLKGKEYEGWMQREKIWPADEISITYVQFLLESLPEGYTGLTKLTQIPACGATVRSAILTYQYDDGWGEHHKGEIQVEFTDGAISAESKYYTESGATLVGTRHADFEIDGVEFKDFAIEVYQEANVITKTDRSELTGIYGLSLKKLNGSEVLINEELSYSAQGLYLIVEGKRTIKYLWSSGSTTTANESVANAKADSVTSSKTAMLTVGSYDATRGYALMLTSNSSRTEARSVVVTVKLGTDTVTRTIYQAVNTSVVYDKNYFKYKFVKTSDFTTVEGDILPVGNIVLIRSNKPGNVGYVVNYTITYEVYGGQTYTKTGTVTLTSGMTEGTEAATVARRLVNPLVSSYSDY